MRDLFRARTSGGQQCRLKRDGRAAQAVEHYEITRYGTLIAWAKQLGRRDAVPLVQQSLDEENATDKKLTAMAERNVNRKAA